MRNLTHDLTQDEMQAGAAAYKRRWKTPPNFSRDLQYIYGRLRDFLAGIDDRRDLLDHLAYDTIHRMATVDTQMTVEQAVNRTISEQTQLRRQGRTMCREGDKVPLPSNLHLAHVM